QLAADREQALSRARDEGRGRGVVRGAAERGWRTSRDGRKGGGKWLKKQKHGNEVRKKALAEHSRGRGCPWTKIFRGRSSVRLTAKTEQIGRTKHGLVTIPRSEGLTNCARKLTAQKWRRI